MSEPITENVPKDCQRRGLKHLTTNKSQNQEIHMSDFDCKLTVMKFGDEILKEFAKRKAGAR